MTPTGKGLLAAGLVVVALVVAVFATRFQSDTGGSLSPVIGAPIPDLRCPAWRGKVR